MHSKTRGVISGMTPEKNNLLSLCKVSHVVYSKTIDKKNPPQNNSILFWLDSRKQNKCLHNFCFLEIAGL